MIDDVAVAVALAVVALTNAYADECILTRHHDVLGLFLIVVVISIKIIKEVLSLSLSSSFSLLLLVLFEKVCYKMLYYNTSVVVL